MARKTKAELSFEQKSREALAARDFAGLAAVYNQYGTYLELVDAPGPAVAEAEQS